VRHQLLEAVRPLLYKILVIQLLLDDDMHQSKGKGAIRTWPNGKVHLRLLGKRDSLRIDHYELGSLGEILLDSELRGKSECSGLWPHKT